MVDERGDHGVVSKGKSIAVKSSVEVLGRAPLAFSGRNLRDTSVVELLVNLGEMGVTGLDNSSGL